MTTGDPIRILLVDDDEDEYVLTRDKLSEIEGASYECDWVPTYEAGLRTIELKEHDLCLLDYSLGKRNGLELLREARAGGIQIPFVLLTGQGDRELDLEAMRSGASDFLVKAEVD